MNVVEKTIVRRHGNNRDSRKKLRIEPGSNPVKYMLFLRNDKMMRIALTGPSQTTVLKSQALLL